MPRGTQSKSRTRRRQPGSSPLVLSVSERIQLVENIWDSIAALPQPIALTQAQREELDRRLDDYRNHPEDGSPWEQVKLRILEER
jgi:putative addiction module component (TIGR02574 family)